MKKLILSLISLFILFGCDTRRPSLGAENEILVLASNEDQEIIHKFLRQIFNDTIFTPQPEVEYKINFAKPEGFKKVKRQTLLVLGSVGENLNNPGTKLIHELLGPEKFNETIDGDQQIIFTHDQFAKTQLFMVLSAANEIQLTKALKGKEKWIKSQFDEMFDLRQSQYLFKQIRKSSQEDDLKEKYQWSLKIPWGWEIIKDSSKANFYWIGKEMPFQWISVQWSEGILLNNISEASALINSYPENYYQHIRFNDYKYNIEEASFQHWSGWKVSGIWESIEEAQGGPFIHYLFYDGVTDRTYQINILVYHPSKKKGIFLRQMALIASTFKVYE